MATALRSIARFYAFQLASAGTLFAKYDMRYWPRVVRVVARSLGRSARFTVKVHARKRTESRAAPASARCTVVLLSYKRPANMDGQIRSALRCAFVDRVIVANNNPEVRLADWITVRDPRLTVVERGAKTGPGIRVALAAEAETDFVISFDDDAFHAPDQLARLFDALVAAPAVVHGTEGEVRLADSASRDHIPTDEPESAYPFECGHKGETREVDALTQGYAFTKAHATRCLELFRVLGMPEPEAIFNGEDITLSASGAGRPHLEDVGEVAECLSCFVDGTALNRSPGFFAFRVGLYDTLAELARLADRTSGNRHEVRRSGDSAPDDPCASLLEYEP